MDAHSYSANVTATSAPSYPSPVAVSPQQLQHHQVQTLPPLQPHNSVMQQNMYGSHPHTPRTPATPNTPGSASTVGGYPQPGPGPAGRGSYSMMPSSSYAQPHTMYATTSASMVPQASVAASHPQPIAPAPSSRPPTLRPNPMQPGSVLSPNGGMNSPYGPGPGQMMGAPQGPPGMGGPEQEPTHVVGSQGRRGVLPSAPGRPPAQPGSGGLKGGLVPVKDAEGKFPCPHCPKTYLHAKHLKRHMLRHTGDRPYMCVLCRDTFSRSDILKRHFQKCSIRRGNPTGASHLSHPQAHVKKQKQGQGENSTDDINHLGNNNMQGGMGGPGMAPDGSYPAYGVLSAPDGMTNMGAGGDSRSPSISRLEDGAGRGQPQPNGPMGGQPSYGQMSGAVNPQMSAYSMPPNMPSNMPPAWEMV